MMIQVTQEDIDAGVEMSTTCCPVANALRRILRRQPMVTHPNILLGGVFFETPRRVKQRIRAFDAGEGLRPFRFRLPIPEAWLQ